MRYYFDASVWRAYFTKSEFFHKQAVKWFEKIREEKHGLYISQVLDKEMMHSPYYSEYLLLSKALCESVIFNEISHIEDIRYFKCRGFDENDIKHVLLSRDNGFIPVTADITHWPKIAWELNYYALFITDIEKRSKKRL